MEPVTTSALTSSFIGQGALFGGITAASITALAFHFPKEKRKEIWKWITTHGVLVDLGLTAVSLYILGSSGLVKGIGMALFGLLVSLIIHYARFHQRVRDALTNLINKHNERTECYA